MESLSDLYKVHLTYSYKKAALNGLPFLFFMRMKWPTAFQDALRILGWALMG